MGTEHGGHAGVRGRTEVWGPITELSSGLRRKAGSWANQAEDDKDSKEESHRKTHHKDGH